MKLNYHEPQKIEWLLRFIYHQDLKWYGAKENSRDGFLPMLIELIILGDYFLVNGLVDAAYEAILDTCSDFFLNLRSYPLDEAIKKDGGIPFFENFTAEIMKAITLTSAASGPTQSSRKFLVKFIVDVLGCNPGISTWSLTEALVFRRQVGLAATLRDFALGLPDLEKDLKAALFDSVFPNLKGRDSQPLNLYKPDDACFLKCRRRLGGDEGNEGIIFGRTYNQGKNSCCLHCAKCLLTVAWGDLMWDDGRR